MRHLAMGIVRAFNALVNLMLLAFALSVGIMIGDLLYIAARKSLGLE